jgi:hypothetical protein
VVHEVLATVDGLELLAPPAPPALVVLPEVLIPPEPPEPPGLLVPPEPPWLVVVLLPPLLPALLVPPVPPWLLVVFVPPEPPGLPVLPGPELPPVFPFVPVSPFPPLPPEPLLPELPAFDPDVPALFAGAGLQPTAEPTRITARAAEGENLGKIWCMWESPTFLGDGSRVSSTIARDSPTILAVR